MNDINDYGPQYSDDEPLPAPSLANHTIRACRNARTIRWLTALSIGEQDDVARLYAGYLKCPLAEVTLDPEYLDNDAIDWLRLYFGPQIDRT